MHNAEADGADGGFGAVLDFEFAEQGFEVSLHRVFAEKQWRADFLVAPAFDEQLQDFKLAPGQFRALLLISSLADHVGW